MSAILLGILIGLIIGTLIDFILCGDRFDEEDVLTRVMAIIVLLVMIMALNLLGIV